MVDSWWHTSYSIFEGNVDTAMSHAFHCLNTSTFAWNFVESLVRWDSNTEPVLTIFWRLVCHLRLRIESSREILIRYVTNAENASDRTAAEIDWNPISPTLSFTYRPFERFFRRCTCIQNGPLGTASMFQIPTQLDAVSLRQNVTIDFLQLCMMASCSSSLCAIWFFCSAQTNPTANSQQTK